MMDIEFYIDGSQVNPPKNWLETSLSLNYDADAPSARVGITVWEFVADEAKLLNDFLNGGTVDGLGILFGLPFEVRVVKNGISETVFNGYLDMTEAESISCDLVVVPAKDLMGIDFLNDVADSFTYEYLFKTNFPLFQDLEGNDKTVHVPYVISSVPNAFELFTGITALVVVNIEIISAINVLREKITKLAGWDFWEIIGIVFQAIYIGILIKTMVDLTAALIDLIIQPVKLHAGMRAKDLCEIGCQHLGYKFSSTILYSDEFKDLVIIPEKYDNSVKKNDFPLGSDDFQSILGNLEADSDEDTGQHGYYNGTFGDLLRALKTMFNAKIVIEPSYTIKIPKLGIGGFITVTVDEPILRLERVDYVNGQSEIFQMPPIDVDEFTTNANEFVSNHVISFELDNIERNTYLHYQGTIAQATLQPERGLPLVGVGGNTRLRLMKGLKETKIPFSRGIRKTSLTPTERVLDRLFKTAGGQLNEVVALYNAKVFQKYMEFNWIKTVLNNMVKAFNGGKGVKFLDSRPPQKYFIKGTPDFRKTLERRKGAMLMHTDEISVPKMIIIKERAKAFKLSDALVTRYATLINGIAPDVDRDFANSDGVFPFLTKDLLKDIEGLRENGNVFLNSVDSSSSNTLRASNIYNKFHAIDSFLPANDVFPHGRELGNQWIIKDVSNVPFCFEDYQRVKRNNFIQDFDGSKALIEQLDWNMFDQTAKIRYRVNKTYTDNLILKSNEIIEPTGR